MLNFLKKTLILQQELLKQAFAMRMNASYEKDLVMLLNQGNETAFEELYHLYSNRLLGFLIRLVKSEILATEILQEAFIKTWNNRKNIDPERSFRSYLYRIAENLVYDFFRKTSRDTRLQKVLMSSMTEAYSCVEENFRRKETSELIQNAIDSLPPRRRQVFQLIKMEEQSYEEVSSLLHVSVSTINDHVVKATKFIREKLEPYHIITVISVLIFLGLL